MTEMLGYVFNNNLGGLVDFLTERIKILEMSGADYATIASNTPHIVFDELQKKVSIPLISIVEETCKVISAIKIQRVGLFGTKSTMTAGFYNKAAKRNGIDMFVPEIKDQDFIHEKYMTELLFNRIVPETKEELVRIVKELKEKESIECLILGGTELPLILSQSDFSDIIILDTTKIHVESIVTKMIEK
jgi:aspartate racemase